MIVCIGLSASFGPFSVVLVFYGAVLPFTMSMYIFLTTYCMALGWDACASPLVSFDHLSAELRRFSELLDVVSRLEYVCKVFLQYIGRAYDCEFIHAHCKDDDMVMHLSVEEAHVYL